MKIIIYMCILVSFSFSNISVYTSNLNIQSISQKEIKNLYLKKVTSINGKKMKIINTIEDYDEFNQKILNKTSSQIHSYWMKQIFRGHKIPPTKIYRKQLSKELLNNKNMIVYSSKDMKKKVIYETN